MKTKIIIYKSTNFADDIPLTNYLKTFTNWAKPFDNVWIVKTSGKTAATIRDELRQILGENAPILVMDITNNGWGTLNISKQVTTWMKENI